MHRELAACYGEEWYDNGLLNVLLAEGINLGLHKMADATTTHGFWELMRIERWHVEGEAYDQALSVVVEVQAALPMAAFWGTGRTASRALKHLEVTHSAEVSDAAPVDPASNDS